MKTQQTKLRAGDLFDKLNQEREHEGRRIDVIKDTRLEKLVKGFEQFLLGKTSRWSWKSQVMNLIGQEEIPLKEIEFFLTSLTHYQDFPGDFDNKSGFYLSQCIYHCSENEINLNNSIMQKVNIIGYRNHGKFITIHGSVGNQLGKEMRSGKIVVYGDAGRGLGYRMKGGEIHVYGNGREIGIDMKGGLIHIHGDTEETIGAGMDGGKICVEGKFGFLPRSIISGDIYHKGTPVVLNGRRMFGG